MTDPEYTTNVAKRDGCNLVVKLGRYRSDENATKAQQWLDIHGLRQLTHIQSAVMQASCGRFDPVDGVDDHAIATVRAYVAARA